MENRLRITRRGVIAAALLVMLASGGVAYATIPDESGVIHGCYTKKVGILSVIDPSAGQTCSSGQLPISWNQQGPQGDPGPQGPPGPPGSGGPLALAHVFADGTVDASRSTGVLSVTKTALSGSGCGGFCAPIPLYCLDLDGTPTNVVATIENSVTHEPPGGPPGISVLAINATVDRAVATDWGCSASADAAVLESPGDGAPFYAVFN
jgi:hypothetical protein